MIDVEARKTQLRSEIAQIEAAALDRVVNGVLTGVRDPEGRSSTFAASASAEVQSALDARRRELEALEHCVSRRPIHVLY